MRPSLSVAIGAVVGVLFILFAVYATASVTALQHPDDYAPYSSAWNGLSQFVSLESASVLQNLSSLPPKGTGYTLIVVGPSTEFSQSDSSVVKGFVSSGGRLVVSDDFGTGNSLLRGIGLRSRFTGRLLTDPLFNFKNSWLVTIPTVEVSGVRSVAMNYATTLAVNDTGASILALSSPFSYLLPSQPSAPVSTAPQGPFPEIARIPLGQGSVYLIADSSVFINSMLGMQGNTELARAIGSGTVLVDGSHWAVGPAAFVRNLEMSVYSTISAPELKYSILLVALGAVLALRLRDDEPLQKEGADELKILIEEHPEWDSDLLKRLKEEMKT